MCGRYALALRPGEVRQRLEQSHMRVDEAPDEDDVRQSYNFAPGYHGLVYRADGPDQGGTLASGEQDRGGDHDNSVQADHASPAVPAEGYDEIKYKLQSMKWGLIPFWTKRNPDYGSVMKTINCRDDSLYEDRGMWTSMKKRKRCIVVAQGFYEWLKKNNGKEKIPHYTRRKDGQLMCFAGLWDCVQYEGSEEKHYTYTIITTDSNKQLNFLHDRMPVILDNGSDEIRTWLDPRRTEWSKELQSLLRPFEGELECYPVSKDVGKVGNNSPSFIIPVNSAANKSNIANFFGNQRRAAEAKKERDEEGKGKEESPSQGVPVEHDVNETRDTTYRVEGSENKAPLPVPVNAALTANGDSRGIKRERSEEDDYDDGDTAASTPQQKRKLSMTSSLASPSARKRAEEKARTRSATSNNGRAAKASEAKGRGSGSGSGSRKITSFFSSK